MKPKKKKLTREDEQELLEITNKTFNPDILSSIHIEIKCKSENQKKLLNSIKENDVTICIGPAGCGKTILSCAEALILLKTHRDIYSKIVLTKSITQLRNEDIGILPGDEKDKLKLYMASYMDSFNKLIGEYLTNKLIELGLIKFEALGTLRGRSFDNVILISDEFQNVNHDNAKTLLTRMSQNSKFIILGDTDQIDIKNKKDSSLEFIHKKINENPMDGVGAVELTNSDIVRHKLTSYFINLFNELKTL